MKQLTIIILFASIIFADTIIVDQNGNGDYTSIQPALNATSAGDTVFVNTGYYFESLDWPNRIIYLIGYNRYDTIISSASNPIDFGYSGSGSIIENLNITALSSSYGISSYQVTEQKIIIINCIIQGAVVGLRIDGNLDLVNCLVMNNTYGIVDYYQGGSSASNIINCVITNNSTGVLSDDGSITVMNSIVYNNDNYGLSCGGNGTLASIFSCVYNNGGSNDNWYNNAVSGAGDISEDPLFIDSGNNNYVLQQASPCIDTGNPATLYNDPDGSRNDMGVYGGPNRWGGSGPVITNIQASPEQVEQGEKITIQATGTVE